MAYEDFDIRIDTKDGQQIVTVLQTPAGAQIEPFQLNLLPHANEFAATEAGLEEKERARQIGERLFDALFTDELLKLFDSSLMQAQGQNGGIRLKLRIADAELAGLPWEVLYDKRNGAFIALSTRTSIVRYVERPQPVISINLPQPLRILGVIADPVDRRVYDVERRHAQLESATLLLREQGLVELVWLVNATWDELMRKMYQEEWHIFHFIGHADFQVADDEGYVYLCDEQGHAHPLSATNLGNLLSQFHSLQLVMLSASQDASLGYDSFSSAATTLVRVGAPAVIAMQGQIGDVGATKFAQTFYDLLAESASSEKAVSLARQALSVAVPDSVQWAVPVFYTHAPESILFQNLVRDGEEEASVSPIDDELPVNVPDKAGNELSTAELRQFLLERFDDTELEALCFDYFRPVSNDFTDGMRKSQKVFLLLDYVYRRDLLPDLMATLERERPTPYAEAFSEYQLIISEVSGQLDTEPKQIFLSHVHSDNDTAERLARELREAGWPVWKAPESIRPGEKWVEAINRGLAGSHYFVLLLSQAALQSKWVASETNAAIDLEHQSELTILFLTLEDCPELSPLWRAYQRIDFRGGYEQGLGQLLPVLADASSEPNTSDPPAPIPNL